MKIAAASSYATNHQIMSTSTQNQERFVLALLPKTNVLKRDLERIRKRANIEPNLPNSISELVIPEEYSITFSGDTFLVYDNGNEGKNRPKTSTENNSQEIGQKNRAIFRAIFSANFFG